MPDFEKMSLEELEALRHSYDAQMAEARLAKGAVAKIIQGRIADADAEAALGADPTPGQVDAMARVVGTLQARAAAASPNVGDK